MIDLGEIEIKTKKDFQIIDITDRINKYISKRKIRNGIAVITTKHTTTSIRINEKEQRLLRDMKKFLEELAEKEKGYLHDCIEKRKDCPKNEPKNAHAHLQSLLMGASETVPIKNGKLDLGKWQRIFFIELDGPRRRNYSLSIITDKD